MNLKLKRTPGIYLVGFMASGKTTIGRHLARRVGWSFYDTDEEIVAAEKCTIAEIFNSRGEAEFRQVENRVIRQHLGWIERGRPAVLALGGGAFVDPTNREVLAANGLNVWLDCPFETVQRRLAAAEGPVRPLAADPDKFASLYETRRAIYRLAEIHIPINGDDPEQTVDAIVKHALFE